MSLGDGNIKLLDQIYITTIKLVKEEKRSVAVFPAFVPLKGQTVERLQRRSLSSIAKTTLDTHFGHIPHFRKAIIVLLFIALYFEL